MRQPQAIASFLLLVASSGCASIPQGRSAIDAVDLTGNKAIPSGDVTDRLATTASPKFLGLFSGLAYDYSIYDASVLQRDMARVERYYRGHGFLEAHARVARVLHVSSSHVRVEIAVDEGPPTLDRDVHLTGVAALPPADAAAARGAAQVALPKGTRFDEDAYKKAQDAVTRALTDRGYAYATVHASAKADLGTHSIDYAFTASPGIAAVFGPITFVGLDPDGAGPKPPFVDDAPLRRAIRIKEGSTYSTDQIEAATQALLDLEIFSAVRILPALSSPPGRVVPLVVEVQPANLRSLKLGGGLEFDAIKTELHGLAGWEDHDLLGGLRDLSIELKPGVVFFPTAASNFVAPTDLLPEERLRLQLRVPAFIEARTTGFIRPEFNVYPLLVQANTTNVVGYVEPKAALGIERRFGKHVFASLAQNLQGETPFKYNTWPAGNAVPPSILLWFPQLITTLDFRDDHVHPHAGFYLSNDFQVLFGSTARDLRIEPEARGYIPLARGVTFGARGLLGMVISPNYGKYLQSDLVPRTGVVPDPPLPNSTRLDQDIETVYFRGFFSGGPSSNRGFPLRGVGPYGTVPFLNPATATAQVACTQNQHTVTSACALPIGGLTLWEASVEVRFDVSGPLGIAIFCDASDVSAYAYKIRLNHPHVSCGAGGRYDTPVGPIRLDIGYRIPSLQVLGYSDESEIYFGNKAKGLPADPSNGFPSRLFGLWPMAVAFGIGESF